MPPTKYGRHKSGQARVVLNGKTVYLGKYGSEESWRRYERLICEWRSNHGRVPDDTRPCIDLTIAGLFTTYWQHVTSYYIKNGQPKEQTNIQQAVRPLIKLYCRVLVAEFGPLSLKAVRVAMIDLGWSRKYINDSISRIKLMFKWGVENEMVAPTIYQGLRAVSGLRKGRSEAREAEPVGPVADEPVDAVRCHVSH